MTTFGFEAEFYSGVERLLPLLCRDGLVNDSRMHRYHCECDWCDDWDKPLRAQTDSSCGGEIISGVFNSNAWDYPLEVIDQLCRGLEAEDVPVSAQCGLHVHVGDTDERMPLTYLAIEHLMMNVVAPGAFDRRRSMNLPLHQAARNMLRNRTNYGMPPGVYWKRRWKAWMDGYRDPVAALDTLLIEAIDADRHVDFNRDIGRTNTSEVRVFNGTRVAWRIELACRLSVAMSELTDLLDRPAIVDAWLAGLNSEQPPEIIDATALLGHLGDIDERCAELFERQLGHITGSAPRTPLGRLLDVYDPVLGAQQFQLEWATTAPPQYTGIVTNPTLYDSFQFSNFDEDDPDDEEDDEDDEPEEDDEMRCPCGDPECGVARVAFRHGHG